jgi:hypothetical protein
VNAEQTYAALVAKFPQADRRDLLDALEAATTAASVRVIGEHLLVRLTLAGVDSEIVEAAELELLAQAVDAEHALEAAMNRASLAT